MIKKISWLKSHITSKIRNFPSKVQVLCLLLFQGEAKLKFLYEMSSHFRGELRQMGGKKKLGFYSISTLNRYKFLLKSRQFPCEVSVPERLFQCDISTWINLRLNCSAMFELKRKKTIYAGSWPRACFYAFMNREEVEIVPKFQNLKVCLAIFFIIGQDQNG